MKQLLNTLFISQEDGYLALNNGNVTVLVDKKPVGKAPLINFQAIIAFTRMGASPALLQECMARNILLSFISPTGKFLGQMTGQTNGNVLLRKEQVRVSDDKGKSALIARNMIAGKLYNQRRLIQRYMRDHELVVDVGVLQNLVDELRESIQAVQLATQLDTIRGIEGNAAAAYFAQFDQLILQHSSEFRFAGRNRRPPLDNVNALLSFAYVMLAEECSGALLSVGLDPYIGFMHTDRPGRKGLALDMMEELRGIYADQFVLTIINKHIMKSSMFEHQDSGAVWLNDEGRRVFLTQWQQRKGDEITHPYLQQKIPWGLVPYSQALLLARYLRGDLDAYPAFLWK
jgi:CRISPR-associated protein Cas1